MAELLHRELSGKIIGAAIEVHRELGPGLLESIYRTCLLHELQVRGLQVETETAVPIRYKRIVIEPGYRADLIVERKVLLELKAVEHLLPIHEAQLFTYMRLCGLQVGFLLNFNTSALRHGLRRLVRSQ